MCVFVCVVCIYMVAIGIKINREVFFHVVGRVICLVVCFVILVVEEKEK